VLTAIVGAMIALIGFVVTIGVLVVLGAWLVTDHVVRHQVRTVPVSRV